MENMDIAKKLRSLRQAKRLNQGEVAEATNIVRSSLSYFESGKRVPSVAQLQTLASFYGVPLDYFGLVKKDDVFELLVRARNVFEADIPEEQKKEVFDELMKLYISLKG
jgi:transcriptional regulator with XRE-family HTH domain